ncbi:uncharacterized protein LOC142624951 [Castanea sativa]|uniref:uncharacterized protein LOC142624951 n=1 Tax=Castanea sativa TaxID=21020 RepID=UPI003F64D5B7
MEGQKAKKYPQWSIHTDESSNKQASRVSNVLRSPKEDEIEYMVRLDFPTTNNEAKYEALVAGLDLAKAAEAMNVIIHCDSQVVTNQMNSDYECKGEKMKKYLEQVKKRVDNLHAKVVQIPKGENEQADRLAKATSTEHMITSGKKDAQAYVRAYNKCQRFSNVIRQPAEELIPITAPWPFAQWGLDIMGAFPIAMRRLKFLIVGIDYFTKWVEAEAIATIIEKNLGIKNHYSSPTHPHTNRQVEVTNPSLLKIIKTRLEGAKGIWPEELPRVLWTYRTTTRTPTRETPFLLACKSEPIILAEVGLTSYKVDNHDERRNDKTRRLQLNLVDKVRAAIKKRLAWYQGIMAKHYNFRVRNRDFQVGDLVWRNVTSATRDPSQGKLRPN